MKQPKTYKIHHNIMVGTIALFSKWNKELFKYKRSRADINMKCSAFVNAREIHDHTSLHRG